MSRVHIEMPDRFHYWTRLQVRLGDVAAGFHMGNHVLVSYLNEALLQFQRDVGLKALLDEATNLITADLAVLYKSEAAHWDVLRIDLAILPSGRYGFDAYYRVTNERTGEETAIAKMAMLFFNYQQKKLVPVPDRFTDLLMEDCAPVPGSESPV